MPPLPPPKCRNLCPHHIFFLLVWFPLSVLSTFYILLTCLTKNLITVSKPVYFSWHLTLLNALRHREGDVLGYTVLLHPQKSYQLWQYPNRCQIPYVTNLTYIVYPEIFYIGIDAQIKLHTVIPFLRKILIYTMSFISRNVYDYFAILPSTWTAAEFVCLEQTLEKCVYVCFVIIMYDLVFLCIYLNIFSEKPYVLNFFSCFFQQFIMKIHIFSSATQKFVFLSTMNILSHRLLNVILILSSHIHL